MQEMKERKTENPSDLGHAHFKFKCKHIYRYLEHETDFVLAKSQ